MAPTGVGVPPARARPQPDRAAARSPPNDTAHRLNRHETWYRTEQDGFLIQSGTALPAGGRPAPVRDRLRRRPARPARAVGALDRRATRAVSDDRAPGGRAAGA